MDPLTGRRKADGLREIFTVPPEEPRPGDYDKFGMVRLPAEYREWLAGEQNRLGDLVVLAHGEEGAPAIGAPAPGTRFFLDGDLPAASQRIALRATSNTDPVWTCPTLLVTDGMAELSEGRHTLTATDPHTGIASETWIDVERW